MTLSIFRVFARFIVLCFGLTLYPSLGLAKSSHAPLKEVHDFQHLGQLMRQKNVPLLLEFHSDSCPYCRLLEEDFLQPMAASREYTDKVLIRQLQIDLDADIIDFDGKTTTAGKFARRYRAFMTPTMIFLDNKGVEVADRIVGINTPSLFSAYIDIEIEKALNRVRAKRSLAKRDVLLEE